MAAMIATLSSPHDEERYPSSVLNPPRPTPTQNERLRLSNYRLGKTYRHPGQVDPQRNRRRRCWAASQLWSPRHRTKRPGCLLPAGHATGPAVPNFTFNTRPPVPVRGPMRLSFEAALAGHSQPVVRSPSNAQSPLHHISEYLASTVLSLNSSRLITGSNSPVQGQTLAQSYQC